MVGALSLHPLGSDRPADARAANTVVPGSTSDGATALTPLAEERINCEVGGIRAPTFTYSGELMTLPFEGYTTCTQPLSQSGQAVLETASGTVVASGSSYNETAASVSSKGVGTSLRSGDYVIVYTETIISPGGWENNLPFCTANGTVLTCTRTDAFPLRLPVPSPKEKLGSDNPASKLRTPCTGDPINCATGNLNETQTDLSVGGRGPGLRAVRTYNALAAAEAPQTGPFGYGWTGPYSAYLSANAETQTATVVQDNGSSVVFILNTATNEYAPAAWVQATLKKAGSNYVYTLPNQTVLEFSGEGQLIREADRDGNAITLTYDAEKRLEAATDPAGRKLQFRYTAAGQVESITDPMGHVAKYAYESGNLVSVTLPGGAGPRWKFEYNASHLMTKLTDGRGQSTTTEYDSSHRVSSQTDPLERKRELKYAVLESGRETKIAEPNGSETVEKFNPSGLPIRTTRASGTSIAATTEYEYDGSDDLLAIIDANKHTTKFAYNTSADKISETDPNGDETKWTYDTTHDVTTTTTPKGETTTIKRNAHGDPETIERPAPYGKTQETTYKYDSSGDLTSITDALERTWKYEYDASGDRVAAIDPEGDKRTWGYDGDSRETSTVSPRGNIPGVNPDKFTTTTERDAQGRARNVSELEPSGAEDDTQSTIGGVPREGQTLSAGVGIWTGAPPLSYAYQWQRCNLWGEACASVSGATGSTYSLTTADTGGTVRLVVTGTNSAGSASSTSEATAVSSTSAPTYSSSFGAKGEGNGQFRHPGDVAVDAKGNLWVLDHGDGRVEVFNEKGKYLRQFGSEGTGAGQLEEPDGLAVDSKDDVWVADTANDRVEEFNEKGEYKKAFGSPGSENGQFSTPEGIAIDSHGNIWVSDTADGRLEEFTELGEYVRTVGSQGSGAGKIGEPEGIAFDPAGNVWIADWSNNRVDEFNEKGEYVAEFGAQGSGAGQINHPYGITMDTTGHIWVAEVGNDRVQEFNMKGEFLSQFGSAGSGINQFSFSFPIGLAGNAKGDLWVTDSNNNRIEEWTSANTLANTAPASISGELIAGQTVTASTGTWAAAPQPTYAYQWQQCNASGEACTNIAGATSATYVVAHGDIGDTLRSVVTASNSAGSASSTSAASGAVVEVAAQTRTTEYAYDANGNVESVVDPKGNRTTYTYDADDEQTKVEEPNKTATETGYDAMGRVTSQIDGNKHTTNYVRNLLGEVTEVRDAVGHATMKEYDAVGNLRAVGDPEKRTTTYVYDPSNRLSEVKYSDGRTPTVRYEYDKDGERIAMIDGTGTTIYGHDQLDRLTETETGHQEVTKYEYDLADEPVRITYPNKKAVTRAYDKNARLTMVTDWKADHIDFAYDADSNLTATTFPSKSEGEDRYTYNAANQMTNVKMLRGTETLASLTYARDSDGQVTATATKGLPGTESSESIYDANGRLAAAGGTTYGYDSANSPTQLGSGSYKYDAASELETGPSLTYTYDELGERTKTTPSTGPATMYGYDEAGNLISVDRPLEGEVAKIEDRYAYNGEGLRTSQTVAGTTSYLAWNVSEELPLLLTDGTNSYIYGPGGLPVEQITSGGTPLYVHHDQQGSTRMLTGSSGTAKATMTYDAYGNMTGHTGTMKAPLGYDGQYTNSDTGLIYLRARVYDPATAQFLSVDPLTAVTREPYIYVVDNPARYRDRTGLGFEVELPESLPCVFPCVPPAIHEGFEETVESVTHRAEGIWNAITENEGPNDEGEQFLHEREEQEAECGARDAPNPGNLERVSDREIKRILDEEGTDPHADKEATVGKEGGAYDYYKDKTTGEIYLVPKGGGEAIPTGLGK